MMRMSVIPDSTASRTRYSMEGFVTHGLEENDSYWADPHLIACAMEDSNIVIVSEESSRNYPQRKIPYVCEQKGIRCIKVLEFLDEINIM